MACDDRQLSEAQRQAGFQQQRTGVMRAVRPFTGSPTLPNLLDYINRELYPAVKQSRDKVNDVYLQVTDNAPSANPLGYYFAEDTTNGDPTGGRIRLDSATQNTATTVRVSQVNGRAEDVLSWLDVMSGGATTPLGVITLFDAINPGRFLRFDLDTMVDQGAYWDLGVTPIESSHDNPFVEGEAIVVSFIAGVASSGTTVPSSSLTPIGPNTVLGNPTASTAAPTEISVADISVLGRMGLSGTGNLEDITVPDTATSTGETMFLKGNSARTALRFINFTLADLPLISDNRFIGNLTGATARPVYTDFADLNSDSIIYENTGKSFIREALTGDITAAQNNNATAFRSFSALSVLARAANSSGVPTELSTTAGSDAVLRESGSALSFGTIATGGLADDSVTNAKLAEMAANTVKANATSATANPTDFAVSTNTVLGRVAGDIVSAQLVNAQITDGTIANAKLADMTARTIKGRADGASTGAPTDLTGAQVGAILRFGNQVGDAVTTGSVATLTVAAGTNQVTFNSVSPVIHGINVPTEIGQLLIIQHIGSGSTTFVHESSTAGAAGQRLRLGPYSANTTALTISQNQSAVFTYDNRWLWLGSASAAFDGDKGDITVSGGGTVWTIDNDVVSNGKLRDSGALSVIGRSANSSGDPADISATAASGAVLRESGSVLGFGTVATAGIADAAVTDAKISNRTALSVFGRSANSSGVGADIAAANDGEILRRSGTAVGFGTIATAGIADDAVTNAKLANMAERRIKGRADSAGTGDPTDLTGAQVGAIHRWGNQVGDASTTGSVATLTVAASTNLYTFNSVSPTLHGISVPTEIGQTLAIQHIGSGSTTIVHESSSAGATGQRFRLGPFAANTSALVIRQGQTALFTYDNRWLWVGGAGALVDGDKGDVTVSSAGATFTIDNDAVSDAKLRNSAGVSVIGRSANSTGDPADIVASANDRVLLRRSNTLTFDQIIDGDIAAGTITLGKIVGIGANTVVGNNTGSATNPLEISIGTNSVLGRVAGNIVAAQVATGQVADAAITLAKQANLAQSRVIGRSEGAGTGVPEALTPTQVVAIIDGESPTWTGSHTFNGTLLTAGTSGDITLSSGGTFTLAASVQVQATSPFRVGDALTLTNVISPTISADTNDWSPSGIFSATIIRVSLTGGNYNLTGITATALDDHLKYLINVSSEADRQLTLVSGSASSSAANRFGIRDNAVLLPGEATTLWYDGDSSLWRILHLGRT
jgi:hypothetical protein